MTCSKYLTYNEVLPAGEPFHWCAGYEEAGRCGSRNGSIGSPLFSEPGIHSGRSVPVFLRLCDFRPSDASSRPGGPPGRAISPFPPPPFRATVQTANSGLRAMRSVILTLVLLLPFAASAATYKCRDASGEWTVQACYRAPPTDLSQTPYQRWLRERQAAEAGRTAARNALGPYCFRLDRLTSFYACVESQMKVYDDIERLKAGLPADSVPRRRLDECLARHHDDTTGATDYRLARECYDKS